MAELTVIEFVTLDGVMQSLGSPDEDRDDGFEYGGWSAAYGDEVLGRKAGEGTGSVASYLFGRRTYELMAARWPNEPDHNPIAASLNATPKYVASNTLTDPDWIGTQVLSGDIPQQVRSLKATILDGVIAVLGSGVLVQSLIEHDLIDHFQIFIHPLVLGAGKRLFGQYAKPLRLTLEDCTVTSTGVLLLSYRRAAL